MIIGIDASRANRREKTGVEWYSFHVILELAKQDKTNQYWLYTDQPLDDELADLVHNQDNFEEKFLRWPLRGLWTLGRLSLEMLLNPPDILFVPGHTLPFFAPKKTMITVHDVGFKRQSQFYQKKSKSFFLDVFARLLTLGRYGANNFDYLDWSTAFAAKRAARLLTVSEFSKSEILHFYPRAQGKIKAIHNGYDDELYFPSSGEAVQKLKKKYKINGDYLLYIGRLEKKKNSALLINAFADLLKKEPGLKLNLVLVGKLGYGGESLEFLVSRLGLTEEVKFLGWVPERELPTLLSGARAFVFSSAYEGFGIPVLQAMACGAPLVLAGSASLPEVAGEAAIYFKSDNTAGLSAVLSEFLKNPELTANLRQKGFARVKNFSWHNTAKQIKKELESL